MSEEQKGIISKEEILTFLKSIGKNANQIQNKKEYGLIENKLLTRYTSPFTKEANRQLAPEESEQIMNVLYKLGYNKNKFSNESRDASCISFNVAKGGVGKTTLSCNIATLLSKRGYDILFIDADPQSNASQFFGFPFAPNGTDVALWDFNKAEIRTSSNYPNIDILTANSELYNTYDLLRIKNWDFNGEGNHQGIEGQWKKDIDFNFKNIINTVRTVYDFIIIDTPPSGGILPLSIYNSTDWVVMPTTLDDYSTEGVLEASRIILKSGLNRFGSFKTAGVIINRYESNDLTKMNHHRLMDKIPEELLSNIISKSINIEYATAGQVDVSEDGKNKSSIELNEVLNELLIKINK